MPVEPLVLSAVPAEPLAPAVQGTAGQRWLLSVSVVAVAGLLLSALLWQKLSAIQEQLARQSADTGIQATHAAVQAKQAQDVAMETAAKLAVTDARLGEVSLQRTQLEELIQSLSRSRDENMVVDVDSAVRLAQQQAQLTGSAEPLLAALKSAEARIARAAQPRLTPVQRAIARDLARIKATVTADTPNLLIKLDELILLVDDVPLANAVAHPRTGEPLKRKPEESVASWWARLGEAVRAEVRNLVRVTHIENPEAALLSPEQSFFVRENLKLRLLNARLGLLSRHIDSARSDLATVNVLLVRYCDASSRKTQTTAALLQQVQGQLRTLVLPRVDDTLAALATAAAGR